MQRNMIFKRVNRNFGLLCLFLTIIFRPQLLCGKQNNKRFDHIGVKDGLSQNLVSCIFQDNKGFMWFGTQEGLNRYDGKNIIVYKDSTPNTKVKSGTFGNVINEICKEENGKIWIGTDKGLLKFNPTMETFFGVDNWSLDKEDIQAICVDGKGSLWVGAGTKVIKVDPQDCKCIGDSKKNLNHVVNDICWVDDGYLWIGTENGLFRLNSYKTPSPLILLDGSNNKSILKIYKDKANKIWVGTEDGKLLKYTQDGIPLKCKKNNKKSGAFFENIYGIGLSAIGEDKQNNLWLGFNGDGIVIYQKDNESLIEDIKKKFHVPGGLKDNFIECIFEDDRGTMWIGTHNQGVNKYSSTKVKFTSYFNDPNDKHSLSGQSIFSIFEDSEGSIWIGTYDGELNRFDPNTEKFEAFDKENFKGKSILSINEVRKGALLIGTSNDLYRFDFDIDGNVKSEKFKQIKKDALGKKNIRIIKKDHDEFHFWIGTEEKGIVKFDPEKDEPVDAFSKNSDSKNKRLSDNNIYSIFPDNEDNSIIWVGTAKNLDKVNKNKQKVFPKQIILIMDDDEDRGILSKVLDLLGKLIKALSGETKDIRILSIVSDPINNDILWLGTDSSGLCKFNKESKESSSFTTRSGLPNNTVYGIFKDEQGYLWFSTNKGIVQFDPKEEKVKRTFDVDDGLQENEFNHGAHCKSHSSHMYFGGVRGLSVFHPAEIEKKIDEKTLPKIYFTELRIGDKEIEIDQILNGKEILSKSISETHKLELDYRQQPFTLEFAALDYSVPDRIKFKYQLLKDEGLNAGAGMDGDGEWISRNSHTFSNLDAGRYIFNVCSTNSDGYKGDITKPIPPQTGIKIIIKKQLWDKLKPIIIPIVIVLGIAVLIIVNFYFVFKTRAKRRIKQLEMIEEAIAEVSKRDHIADVIFKMLDFIVYGFGFDYAAISVIDILNSTIETSRGKTSKPNIIDQKRWNQGFKCKLNEVNILTKVVEKRKTIEVLDSDLNRVFLPIEFQAKGKGKDIIKAESNLIFGVVEAGFHRSTKPKIPEELKIILELFLSYCASLFHRALKISEKQIVENLLKRSSEIENHKEYLESVLANAAKLIRGDKGDISFFSFNENKIDFSNTPIFYNVDNKEDRKRFRRRLQNGPKKGVVRHAAETNQYYICNDVKSDPFYIEEFKDIKSELAVPMRYSDRVIGVFNINSYEKNLFNNIKADVIQIIADEAAKMFLKKKINQTIKKLVLPFHLFVGIEKIYERIIDNIRDYFITEFVSIWEKGEEKSINFKLEIACNKLEEMYIEYDLIYLEREVLGTNTKEIQVINFEEKDCPDCGFNGFAKEYDLKAMILVPIIVDRQVYGFINIFSKRKLPTLFPEDKTFLNLIALKGAISVQHEKLIASFTEISGSLPSGNLDEILKNIADSARKVLHANPVILFKYDQTQENFEATFSGYIFHRDLENVIKHAKKEDQIVSYVIKKGSVWFKNSDDYQHYINEIGMKHRGIHFKEDFWTREKIKSSVGIRLEHNERPIGVMFFNYRDEQRFDENTKRFIEAFSSFASSAIVNARYLDLIEKQRKKLAEQKEQLETQKEKLEFDFEEIYQKMTEMLPRATRTSFYLILEGINHDIRNFLIRMKQALMDINENSERLHKKERNTINVRVKDIERNIRNVTNLLKLFNFRNAGKEAIDIKELVKELIFFFKTRESESISFNIEELKDGIPHIICNKAELSMIIYNMLSNSVHAVVEKEDPNSEIKIKTDFDNNEYIIIVEDNGVGIDNNDIPHIFEAGFTRKEKGMGIGLYFVNETLRENFWGTVVCNSLYGQWTKFTIKIPESVNYKD